MEEELVVAVVVDTVEVAEDTEVAVGKVQVDTMDAAAVGREDSGRMARSGTSA